jgi:DNA polymerase III alpha subunit (gram-positive type)
MNYTIYICDTETTGLDSRKHDVIEICLYRLNDGAEKTWCLKPLNPDNIEVVALRINGHKLEDLTHKTKNGINTYLDPHKVIVEIENWMSEDNTPVQNRVLCGQNISFDKDMLQQLWSKCNSTETFPFGRRMVDTMGIEFFMDLCKGTMSEGYSLANLVKKYGIKNEKAHTAASDVKATKEVFQNQIDFIKKLLAS